MLKPFSRGRQYGLRIIVAALLCVFIAGCDTVPKIETVQIAVPVPVKRECPAELCAPVDYGPMPVFKAGEGNDVVLDDEGQARLRDLIVSLKGRVEAFRDWAGDHP